MSTTIESLELEIHSNSQSAVDGIDALTQSLNKLKDATKGGLGLKSIAKGLSDIGVAISGITGDAVAHTQGLAKAIDLLNGKKISTSIAKQVTAINDALKSADFSGGEAKITELVQVLKPLETLGKSSFSSTVNALKKLPEAIAKIDTRALYNKIQSLTRIFKPLADEMEKIAKGFSAMPAKIQRLIKESEKIPKANEKSSTSFTDLYHKLKTVVNGFKVVTKSIYSAIKKSSEYNEVVNLFSVSLGKYASEAYDYAESVSDVMGIDPTEWMKSQGVFMTLATGFGVAGDRANTMSQQLTQLGYDISSFQDISVEDAMQKLQSGLSGELEPLRRIGYDLSQAKLEATALELGIDKTVSSMTQAEKAQLRYYAIMTQVTQQHQDMANTLEEPANQMRIFKAQVNMAAREIGNAFIPALQAILPYATAIVKVVGTLASIIAELAGYIAPVVEDKGIGELASGAESASDSLEDATNSAKKLKSYMLGFDELNVINPNEGSSSSAEDALSGFNFELPTYDFLEGVGESKFSKITEEMKEWLGITEDIDSWSELLETRFGNILISAGLIATSLLAWKVAESAEKTITAISNLTKVGSFTLGLALVVTGITIGALAIESALTEGLNGVNAATLLTASASLIAGGALIGKTFGGTIIGAAVGAIIAGVAGLGIGIYDAINNELNVTNGLVIAASATLIGIAVASLLPHIVIAGTTIGGTFAKSMLGAATGLVVAGAIAGAIWIVQNTESTLEKIGGIVSGAFLAVGAVLAFMGVSLPLGIALMATGALTMGSSILLNTDALSEDVKAVIVGITGAVSVALLAVGAVLAFTGANIPLGIALIAGGALALATVVAPNWNYLADALHGTVAEITGIISVALLALGGILCLTGVGIPLGIALIAVGAAGLATVVALNWNAVKDMISNVLSTIGKILSGAMLALGVLMCLSGVGIGLGLALIFGSLKLSTKAWGTDDNPIINFVKKMVNGIVKIVNLAIDAINDIGNIKFKGFSLGGVEIIPAFNTKLWNIPKIPLMAEGGFPEQGQMFIAREAGAEMVGNIGRRTAVANNDQIVAGIAGGVAEANEEQNTLLREQNSLLRAILEKDSGVYLDGKNLTNSVEKYQRERGRVLITGGVL